MILRAAAVAVVVLGGGAYASLAPARDRQVARTRLAALPCDVDRWRCAGDTPLDRNTLAALGVDDYVNRAYRVPATGQSDGTRRSLESIGVYIGYYGSQRQGESIHSPQNCLPGSGWQPVSSTGTTIDAAGTPLPVNRFVVQKDLERQVVLYWYQGRGRVIANEFVNKFWLMLDQATRHRSNGALVRIVAPVAGTDERALASASTSAEQFARAFYPRLSPYLP
jgi:EpsI family protein